MRTTRQLIPSAAGAERYLAPGGTPARFVVVSDGISTDTTERAHDDRHHGFPPLRQLVPLRRLARRPSANVRELLEVKRMHLTALLVMTCGVVGGGHAQETERRGARQFPVVLPGDRRSVP